MCLGLIIIFILRQAKITFNFAMHTGLVLRPSIKCLTCLTVSLIVIVVAISRKSSARLQGFQDGAD